MVVGSRLALLVVTLVGFMSSVTALRASAAIRTQPSAGQQPTAAEAANKDRAAAPEHQQSIGGELAEETREADGAEEEEHANLKHCPHRFRGWPA